MEFWPIRRRDFSLKFTRPPKSKASGWGGAIGTWIGMSSPRMPGARSMAADVLLPDLSEAYGPTDTGIAIRRSARNGSPAYPRLRSASWVLAGNASIPSVRAWISSTMRMIRPRSASVKGGAGFGQPGDGARGGGAERKRPAIGQPMRHGIGASRLRDPVRTRSSHSTVPVLVSPQCTTGSAA